MQRLIFLTLVTLAPFSPAPQLSAQAPTPVLLVLSKRAHTLSMVNPVTLKVTASVDAGPDPHEVIASADGATAYVSNYGFGAFNTISVVNLATAKAMPRIDLGLLRGPHGLAFVDGHLWFTTEVAKAIGRFNPETQSIDMILGNGQNRVHMVYVSPSVERIVATNVTSGTVSIFDLETRRPMGPPPGGAPGSSGPPPPPPPPERAPPPAKDWNQTIVKVGEGSEGFDVSPDGHTAWVANAQDGTISVVDLDSKRVTNTLEANVPRANRLKFTPDGKRVLTTAGPEVVVLDVGTKQVVKRIHVGSGSAGLLVQPDGTRAFVSCGPDNYVAVIDLATLTVTGHISAGDEPDGLAWVARR